jgi:hypothetical protein
MAAEMQPTPRAALFAIIERVNEELHGALEQLVVALQCEHVSMTASGAGGEVDKQMRGWGSSSAASYASDLPHSLTALFHDQRLRRFVVVWIATALTSARVVWVDDDAADATERVFSRNRACNAGWAAEGHFWRVDGIGCRLADATERFSQSSCCRVGWAAEGACMALVTALKAAETDARRQSITNAISCLVAQYSFSKLFDLQVLIWWYRPATNELNMAAWRLITEVRNRMMYRPGVSDTDWTLKEKELRIALDRQQECKRMAVEIKPTRATALVVIIERVNEEYLFRSKRAILIQKFIRRHMSRSEFQKQRQFFLFHGHLILNGCLRVTGRPFTRYPSPFFARPLAEFIAQIGCASRLQLARAHFRLRPGAAWPLLHAAPRSARCCLSAINQRQLCSNRSREVGFIAGRLMVHHVQLLPTVYISDNDLLCFSGNIVDRVFRGHCRRAFQSGLLIRVSEYRDQKRKEAQEALRKQLTMEEVD